MGKKDDESSLSQGMEKEEFVFYTVEIVSMIGVIAILLTAVDYRDSVPNASVIGLSLVALLLGFTFERGMLSSQMSSGLRKRIWWLGPTIFLGMILLMTLIEGTLLTLTLNDVGILVFFYVSWIVGAGFKRLLVRGRFERAYRGLIAKAGKKKLVFDRKSFIIWVVFILVVVAVNLISYILHHDDFQKNLAGSLMFAIIMATFLSCMTDRTFIHSVKATEVE